MLGVWLAINPFVFGKPADHRNWATRAMLGEEQWIIRRPHDAAAALSVVTSAAAVVGVVAARRRRLGTAAAATAVQMALTLVYWELMVRYFDRRSQ